MKQIVVIGSSNTDMVMKIDRFPVPGETVSGGEFRMTPGGKGANQAVAAARLGADTVFVCKVGNDVFGQQAVAGFKKENINTAYISTDMEMPSGVASILIDGSGENCIAVAPGANRGLMPEDMDQISGVFHTAGILLLQLEIPLSTVERAAAMGRQAGVPVILNPAPAQPLSPELLKQVDIITPNETEATLLSGVPITDESSMKQAAEVLRGQGVGTVIITLGSRGAYIQSRTLSTIIPAEKVVPVDTTAAGDTFNGALAVGIANGWALERAVEFANKAAALSVTRIGAQNSAPYLKEIR